MSEAPAPLTPAAGASCVPLVRGSYDASYTLTMDEYTRLTVLNAEYVRQDFYSACP